MLSYWGRAAKKKEKAGPPKQENTEKNKLFPKRQKGLKSTTPRTPGVKELEEGELESHRQNSLNYGWGDGGS